MAKIKVKDVEVSVIKFNDKDYICLTDMVKAIENGLSKQERLLKLNGTAIRQMEILENLNNRELSK